VQRTRFILRVNARPVAQSHSGISRFSARQESHRVTVRLRHALPNVISTTRSKGVCCNPISTLRRQPFASTDAATFRCAERATAQNARPSSRRRSTPLAGTFARSNCVGCTAKSSSSASVCAAWRFATDATNSV